MPATVYQRTVLGRSSAELHALLSRNTKQNGWMSPAEAIARAAKEGGCCRRAFAAPRLRRSCAHDISGAGGRAHLRGGGRQCCTWRKSCWGDDHRQKRRVRE